MSADLLAQRAELLQQMASLTVMELGSLKAEYREGPSGESLGPYFKHQVWDRGANVSRRVPAQEAPGLQAAIANRQRFETLATQFIELTVRLTRQSQAGAAQKETPRHVALRRKRRSRS